MRATGRIVAVSPRPILTTLARAARGGPGGEPAEVSRLAVVVWEKTPGVPARVLATCPPAELHEWTWQPAFSADPLRVLQRLTALVIDGPASRSRVSANELLADPAPLELAATAPPGDAAGLPPEATFCGYRILDAQGASPRGMLIVPAAAELTGPHAVVEELISRLGLLVTVTETTRAGVRFELEDVGYYAVWDPADHTGEDPAHPGGQPRFRVLAQGQADPLLERLVRVLLASSRLPAWTLRGDDAFYRAAIALAPPATLSHLFWPDPTTLEGTEAFNDWLDWLDRLVHARRLAEVAVRATVLGADGTREDPLAVSWEPRKGRQEVSCELAAVRPEQIERLTGVVLVVQPEGD